MANGFVENVVYPVGSMIGDIILGALLGPEGYLRMEDLKRQRTLQNLLGAGFVGEPVEGVREPRGLWGRALEGVGLLEPTPARPLTAAEKYALAQGALAARQASLGLQEAELDLAGKRLNQAIAQRKFEEEFSPEVEAERRRRAKLLNQLTEAQIAHYSQGDRAGGYGLGDLLGLARFQASERQRAINEARDLAVRDPRYRRASADLEAAIRNINAINAATIGWEDVPEGVSLEAEVAKRDAAIQQMADIEQEYINAAMGKAPATKTPAPKPEGTWELDPDLQPISRQPQLGSFMDSIEPILRFVESLSPFIPPPHPAGPGFEGGQSTPELDYTPAG